VRSWRRTPPNTTNTATLSADQAILRKAIGPLAKMANGTSWFATRPFATSRVLNRRCANKRLFALSPSLKVLD